MAGSQKKWGGIDKEKFKNIFIDHWGNFKKDNPRYNTGQYNEPVEKMLECGDASGGYTEYRCLHCGRDTRRVAFSCKSCFCLSCARKYTDDFVSQISSVMHHGVSYRHIVLIACFYTISGIC